MSRNAVVPRALGPHLLKMARAFPAVALTGPRQSGKSTLLKSLFGKTHAYLTLDDLLSREQALSDPKLFLSSRAGPLIIDEIQYAPALLSYIKIMIDQRRTLRGRFLLTGSQQFPLIKNLGDTLAGRVGVAELLPFSVHEADQASSARRGRPDAVARFLSACRRGLFPELVCRRNLDPREWYGSYLRTYLERDVRDLSRIGNLRDFQRFVRLLAARCAQILNMSAMSVELGVSVNTLKSWLSILEAGRIIFILSPYYQNFGKRITQNPKVYFLDVGLVSDLLGITNDAQITSGPFAGALFENFCVQETVKALLHGGERPSLYFLRTHNGLEVDLLIERDGGIHPVEFKLTKTPSLGALKPMSDIKGLFPTLPWRKGHLVTGASETLPLTRDSSLTTLDDYLSWLERYALKLP